MQRSTCYEQDDILIFCKRFYRAVLSETTVEATSICTSFKSKQYREKRIVVSFETKEPQQLTLHGLHKNRNVNLQQAVLRAEEWKQPFSTL